MELAVQVECRPAGSFCKLEAPLIADPPALRYSPPVPMIKLTKEREIDPYSSYLRRRRAEDSGSLARAFLSAIGTLQAAHCYNNVWSLKHLNQPVKEALIIVRPGLEVFFEDTLRVTYCLKRYLLVGH